jgi:transcriptional regulator with XRE-family HTH domain
MAVISLNGEDLPVRRRPRAYRVRSVGRNGLESFPVENGEESATGEKRKPTELGWVVLSAMTAAGFRRQAQLARAAEVAPSTISRLIYGGVDIPEERVLAKVAEALGIDAAELKAKAGYSISGNARQIDPLALELDQLIGEGSPLPPERRDALRALVDRVMEPDRGELVRRMHLRRQGA